MGCYMSVDVSFVENDIEEIEMEKEDDHVIPLLEWEIQKLFYPKDEE